MEKKIRDLTIQEILDIHNDEDFEGCDNCPFDDTILCNLIHSKHQEYLDKEVEVKETKDLDVLKILKRNVGIRLAIQEWANEETRVFPNDRKIVKQWLEEDLNATNN